MKVKVVEGFDNESFEREINYEIESLIEENKEIIDIKFGADIYSSCHMYSAMIIYR